MLTATIVAGLIVSALSGALIGHTDRWVRAVTGALVFVSLVLALTTVWFWKSRYAPAVVLLGAALAGWAVFR